MTPNEAIEGQEDVRAVEGDDAFVKVLVVRALQSWPLDKREAFQAEVSAAVEEIAARYHDGVPS